MADATTQKKWPRKAEILLVAFVASVVVVLEGQLHAFEVLDQLALSALRMSGFFELKTLSRSVSPKDIACETPLSKYLVVRLPSSGPGGRDPQSPTPASAHTGSIDLPFDVVTTLHKLGPNVLAVDMDLTRSPTAIARSAAIRAAGDSGSAPEWTRFAFIALPISEEDGDSVARRGRRNDWLKTVCKNPRVAIASPHVSQSRFFGDVVQFHWEKVDGGDELPPAYPALGQVVGLLGRGLDAGNVTSGPGFVCDYLKKSQGAVRIPFIDLPKTPGELSDSRFVSAAHPSTTYRVEWTNPSALAENISLVSVKSKEDLQALVQRGEQCVKNRIVFVGVEPKDLPYDTFSTMAGDVTPGVVVHAMNSLSVERRFASALALSAALDVLAGYSLITLLNMFSFKKLRDNESFFLRNLYKVFQLLAPVLIIALVVLLSWFFLLRGLFLNPIVVAVGIWLHGVFKSFFEEKEGSDADAPSPWSEILPGWFSAIFPRVKMAKSGCINVLDWLTYGGSICFFLLFLCLALYTVVTRLRVSLL